jgi:hypothetical protein
MEGISAAYENRYPGKDLFSFSVKVNKDKGKESDGQSKGMLWWLILIFVAMSVAIWRLKNKK